MTNTILLVDDEPGVLAALKRILLDEDYEIITAGSGTEGLEVLKNNDIKLVVSDEKMPGMSGTEFLSSVKSLFPHTVRVMLTGHASLEAAMKAVNSGEIYRFFSKPWNDVEIKLAVRSAIEKYNLEEENRRLLMTVKCQADELRQIEEKHPGITSLEKDEEGHFILDERACSDKDMSQIVTDILSQSDS